LLGSRFTISVDWLEQQNCELCPLCKRTMKTAAEMFVHCRYASRIWGLIKDWLGIASTDLLTWPMLTLNSWWLNIFVSASPNCKALASLTLLVTREIWNVRNARVFETMHAQTMVVFDKIKKEAEPLGSYGWDAFECINITRVIQSCDLLPLFYILLNLSLMNWMIQSFCLCFFLKECCVERVHMEISLRQRWGQIWCLAHAWFWANQ
jgi:hypothetical protein